MPRLILFGKPGCHLCEQVETLLVLLEREADFEWVSRDITTDPALYARYQHAVPVVWVNGQEALRADVAPIDAAALRALVATPDSLQSDPA